MMGDSLTIREAIEELAGTHLVPPLRARYREPWRAYHDEQHILEIKDHLIAAEDAGVPIVDGSAAIAFTGWHDCILDPQAARGRNEMLSAQLCAAEFGTVGHPTSVQRACEAILATIGHRPPETSLCPDAPLLLDCDLAILGAPPERFDIYDADIRIEHMYAPEDVYRARRAEILAKFLKRDRLFLTDWAYEMWEAQARENLERAISRLRDGQ